MMSTKPKKETNKVNNVRYSNKNVGFSLSIPDNWMEVKKSSYLDLGINENTLCAFVVDKFTHLSVIFSGFCTETEFKKINVSKEELPFQILYEKNLTYKNIPARQLVISKDDKKLINTFCLINGMLIDFTINISLKNKNFDKSKLSNDNNFKTINSVLNTLEVYEPVNPPIYVDRDVPDVKEVKMVNNREEMTKIILPQRPAEIIIENECKYRNILMPNFYLKYVNNGKTKLSVIDKEVYFIDKNNHYRSVNVNDDLLKSISSVIEKKWVELETMDCGYQKITTDSYFSVKLNRSYGSGFLYIDVNKCEGFRIFDNIVRMVQEYVSFDYSKETPVEENVEIKEEIAPLEEDVDEIMPVLKEIREKDITEKMPIPEVEEEEEQEEVVLPIEDVASKSVAGNVFVPTIEEMPEEEEEVLEENLEESPKIDTPIEEKKEEEETDTSENVEFLEYFHNVDGHNSFRFLFPVDSGEKVERDFNVFDIQKGDDISYRIFIFKCENKEKYESKLQDWMNKNVQSSNSRIIDEREEKSDSLSIKTFILENGKFYKAIYVSGYLIAVSGLAINEIMSFADHALKTVEIGEDDRSNIEALNRKMNSISILQQQGIPYIDELPPLPSSYDIVGKTYDEIAKRAIALCICCNYASDIVSNKKKKYIKESKKFFNKLLDKYNVKDIMTKEERELFEKGNRDVAIQISWQFEGCAVLLWTLGLLDYPSYPDTLVNPDEITSIISSCNNYSEFIRKCEFRSVEEILDLADLTYRYNWYCVDAQIEGEEPKINSEIVVERYRALKWLLTDEKWDKVDINT